MALDKSDPFPGLPRPSMFGQKPSVGERLIEAAKEVAAIARGEKPVTKSVTELRNAVTEIEKTPKRGRRPRGESALTPAEKQRLYRERKRAAGKPAR